MKKLRLLLITLCVSVLMGSMAVTAYAGGGEEWDGQLLCKYRRHCAMFRVLYMLP